MPVPPLTDLISPVSADDVMAQELSYAQVIGLPATAWQPISIGREIMYINASVVASFSEVMQSGVVAGGFITYAKGGWLTLLCHELQETDRIEANYASGLITLTNSTGLPIPVSAGDVRVLNETTEKTYTSTAADTIPANGSIQLAFVADQPGTASNLTSTDVLSLVNTIPGVTPSFYENLVGQNEETDSALRTRARQANAKASPNGPAAAYEYFAKSTTRPDGTNVGVTRVNAKSVNGTIVLYLATPTGALTTTDAQYVFDNVNSNVVPTGMALFIPTPTCVELPFSVAIAFRKNPNSSALNQDIADRVEAAIVDYFASVPVGGDNALSFRGIFASTFMQIVRNAAGSDVYDAVVSNLSDVLLQENQIPVLSSFTVSWI